MGMPGCPRTTVPRRAPAAAHLQAALRGQRARSDGSMPGCEDAHGAACSLPTLWGQHITQGAASAANSNVEKHQHRFVLPPSLCIGSTEYYYC